MRKSMSLGRMYSNVLESGFRTLNTNVGNSMYVGQQT
jgi:hypothetical protein